MAVAQLLVFLLAALAFFSLGKSLLALFRLPLYSRLEEAALAGGLGAGILALSTLGLGIAGFLYP